MKKLLLKLANLFSSEKAEIRATQSSTLKHTIIERGDYVLTIDGEVDWKQVKAIVDAEYNIAYATKETLPINIESIDVVDVDIISAPSITSINDSLKNVLYPLESPVKNRPLTPKINEAELEELEEPTYDKSDFWNTEPISLQEYVETSSSTIQYVFKDKMNLCLSDSINPDLVVVRDVDMYAFERLIESIYSNKNFKGIMCILYLLRFGVITQSLATRAFGVKSLRSLIAKLKLNGIDVKPVKRIVLKQGGVEKMYYLNHE